MRKGYKIICNTAAGRHRYLKLLIPYVLSCDIVDRYDIWVNTVNETDLRFLELLAKKYPKINLLYIDDGNFQGVRSVFGFYKYCLEEKSIYVKLDDDLIWLEKDTITKMVDFRIDHPEYFVVSPLVINNCSGSYILQCENKLSTKPYLPPAMCWDSGWCHASSAYQLLDWFYNQVKKDDYNYLHGAEKPVAMLRFSINMILWFGETFREFEGIIPKDTNDEEFLTCIKPTQLGMANCINTDTLAVHFAFSGQRKDLDTTDILEKYESLIECSNNLPLKEVYQTMNELIRVAKDMKVPIDIPNYHNLCATKKTWKQYLGSIPIPNSLYTCGRLWHTIHEGFWHFDKKLPENS